MLEQLMTAHAAGKLRFFAAHTALADTTAFAAFLKRLRRCEWVVYAKPPFGGPEAVLAYLSRYTHRVAISNRRLIAADANSVTNRRLIAADANSVTFNYKDYRIEGAGRYKTMTLETAEFIVSGSPIPLL